MAVFIALFLLLRLFHTHVLVDHKAEACRTPALVTHQVGPGARIRRLLDKEGLPCFLASLGCTRSLAGSRQGLGLEHLWATSRGVQARDRC